MSVLRSAGDLSRRLFPSHALTAWE